MSKLDEIGLTNNETQSTPGDDTVHYVEADVAQANVFFDGTENNYFNVTTDQKRPKQDSYINALTNIALMWEPFKDDREANFVYIEGAGTTRMQDDSLTGLATGTGETGVEARALSAFQQIEKVVTQSRGNKGLPALLDINVFGFSRGAAAARHFVHLVNTEGKQRFSETFRPVTARIRFVGLFDTVASVLGHNTDSLHLRFAPNAAYKVFHLVAGDDYRHYFPCTTIASAVAQTVRTDGESFPMGYELRIPGAHSDVGGGYHPAALEERSISFAMQDFVYDKGWFKPSDQKDVFAPHRRMVLGEYHKVGLALMVDAAHKYTATQYPAKLLMAPKDPAVLSIRETLRAVAKEGKRSVWDLDAELGQDAARAFRHQFLHMSMNERSTANYPAGNIAQGQLQRESIQG